MTGLTRYSWQHVSVSHDSNNNNNPIYLNSSASEVLAAGQSWVLLKSLTEEIRLKPRFKDSKLALIIVRSLTRALMWRLRYVGAVALLRLLKVNTATLYSILCWMGNQCSSRSNGWAWDRLGAWRTILVALFCTRCRPSMLLAGAPYSTELQ